MPKNVKECLALGLCFLSLSACTNRPSSSASAGSGAVQVPPSVSGQISRLNSGDILTGADVVFRVTATGGSQYRFIRSDGAPVLNFAASVDYTKRFSQAGQFNESGVIQSLNSAGQVVASVSVSTGIFNVTESGTDVLSCSRLVGVPSIIYAQPGTGNVLVAPAQFTFYAATSKPARVDTLALASGGPIQLSGNSQAMDVSHKFQGAINAFGSFIVQATFTNGTETARCEVPVEVRTAQAGVSAPSCSANAMPNPVSSGAASQINVTVGVQTPAQEIWVEDVKLAPGVFSAPITRPAGSYQIAVVVSGTGGVGTCSTPLDVLASGGAGIPSCNFGPTVYPPTLAIGESMLFSLTLGLGSAIPTSVTINGAPATANPAIANRWDLPVVFATAGVFTVEGRVTNAQGTGSCVAQAVTVTNPVVVPVCSVTVSNAYPEDGKSFSATLVHSNAADSGNVLSATLSYGGQSFQSSNPYPNFSRSFVAKVGTTEVVGQVNGPTGTGTCRVAVRAVPKLCVGGVLLSGGCWYLSALGQSCDSVCATRGGYDANRALYAHSVSGCGIVLGALQVSFPNPSVWSQPNNPPGLSCFWYLETLSGWLHTASAPLGSSAFPTARRACACRN